MEASCFSVDAQALVDSGDTSARPQVLVATSLLSLNSPCVGEVMGLEQHQQSKDCLPLEVKKIKLDEYYVVTLERQTVFAHAVAVCRHQMTTSAGSLGHSMDDQFFFMGPSEGQEAPFALAKKDSRAKVFSLRTAESGFLDETCLLFFPHYKVAVSFTWGTVDNKKVENQVGEYFTIGQKSWTMSWAPEGASRSTPLLCTFGRNMSTRYTGLVPMDKLVELEHRELEEWGRKNAFPASPNQYQSQHRTVPVSCEHGYGGGCFADGGPDVMEEFESSRGARYVPQS